MTSRVVCAAAGLVVVLVAGCATTTGTPVAAPVTTTTTTTETMTTTEATTTTATQAPPKIPKPKWSHKVQVGPGTNVPLKAAYQLSYLQVQSVTGGTVAILAEMAPGSPGSFACYDSCDLSAGSVVSIGGLHAGATVSLNNMVLVVDNVRGGHAQLTIGTLH